MNKKYMSFLLIIGLLSSAGINAATLFVESLGDTLGTVATLRQTILDANSGDTIEFNISGTIFLDEFLGELVVDKQLTIDGDNKITVDGQDQINICFHIANIGTADASGSIIQNITIQNFSGANVHPGSGTEPQELPAYGIFIEGGAVDCSVLNATIKNINAGASAGGVASGIFSLVNIQEVTGNTIENITSENNLVSNSSDVFGVRIIASVSGNCSSNTISGLSSGDTDNNSGGAIGISITGSIDGDCSSNTINSLSSGDADNSGGINGIFISLISGDCSNNMISSLSSGDANSTSGSATGINITNLAGGDCSSNTISNLSSGNANSTSGSTAGINITNLAGGACSDNTISNLSSGDADNRGFVNGITIINLAGGICSNNMITDLLVGVGDNFGAITGINIFLVTPGSTGSSLISCNTVLRLTGNESTVTGVLIKDGDSLTIQGNIIDLIQNMNGPSYGLLLGDTNNAVTNSLISFNTISNIIGNNNNGFGITLLNSGSTGNDFLNNSIFIINGKAINIFNNGVPVDAIVKLNSVRCTDGCKLIVEGYIIPSIDVPQFKLQFFVSDSNTPEQTQTFIAERIIDTPANFSFKLRLTGLPPVTFGQYITATATALPDGSAENNNTSEVSNALPACKPTGNFCPCAEVVLPEPPACPVTG